MSLLNTKLKRFTLKQVTLPAPKERELKPLEEVIVKKPIIEPIIKDKVKDEVIVVEVKKEFKTVLKQLKTKSLWDSLDNSSRVFWIAGGRGGEVGFTTFENNKKY